jgi:hypothetical protein
MRRGRPPLTVLLRAALPGRLPRDGRPGGFYGGSGTGPNGTAGTTGTNGSPGRPGTNGVGTDPDSN